MPSSILSGRQRDALMQHLDSLFALAQVVSPNAEEAVHLIEATFRRAFSTPRQFEPPAPSETEFPFPEERPAGTMPMDSESGDQIRIWLFRLMMQTRAELASKSASDAAECTTSGASVPSTIELADLRRRLAEEFVDRTLPAAFSTLPSEQRVLLMLCDLERMDCGDAARVLALDPAVSCARYEEAHATLHRALSASATEAERHLLETGLSATWQPAALQRMVESRLVVVPPTLRPAVASIFKSLSQPDESSEDAPEIGEHVGKVDAAGRPWAGLLTKFAAILSLIVVAGFLGYAFTYFTRHDPNVNVISLSAQQAPSVEASFQTSSAEQAERYIFDRLGSRVTLPTIAEASLQGVSIRPVVNGAEVPVLLFQDAPTGRPITVYVYSYAFLDRHEKDLVLERDILRQIEAEGNFDLHDLGEEKALVWRYRDDIFVAITSGDAEALRSRIIFPS